MEGGAVPRPPCVLRTLTTPSPIASSCASEKCGMALSRSSSSTTEGWHQDASRNVASSRFFTRWGFWPGGVAHVNQS